MNEKPLFEVFQFSGAAGRFTISMAVILDVLDLIER